MGKTAKGLRHTLRALYRQALCQTSETPSLHCCKRGVDFRRARTRFLASALRWSENMDSRDVCFSSSWNQLRLSSTATWPWPRRYISVSILHTGRVHSAVNSAESSPLFMFAVLLGEFV